VLGLTPVVRYTPLAVTVGAVANHQRDEGGPH